MEVIENQFKQVKHKQTLSVAYMWTFPGNIWPARWRILKVDWAGDRFEVWVFPESTTADTVSLDLFIWLTLVISLGDIRWLGRTITCVEWHRASLTQLCQNLQLIVRFVSWKAVLSISFLLNALASHSSGIQTTNTNKNQQNQRNKHTNKRSLFFPNNRHW